MIEIKSTVEYDSALTETSKELADMVRKKASQKFANEIYKNDIIVEHERFFAKSEHGFTFGSCDREQITLHAFLLSIEDLKKINNLLYFFRPVIPVELDSKYDDLMEIFNLSKK